MTGPWIAVVAALWVSVVVMLVVLLGLLRRVLPILERAELHLQHGGTDDVAGFAPGDIMPNFELIDANDRTVELQEILRQHECLLLLNTGCPPCQQLVAEITETSESLAELRLNLVLDMNARLDLDAVTQTGVRVFRQKDRAEAIHSGTAVYPQALIVDAERVVIHDGSPNGLTGLQQWIWSHLPRGEPEHKHEELMIEP